MVSANTLIKNILNVNNVVVEKIDFLSFTREDTLMVRLRPYKRDQYRCPFCQRKCPVYDQGSKRRLWRSMDLGTYKVMLDGPCPRIECREHGIHAAAVPWAFPNSSFTKDFDITAAWMAQYLPKSAVSEYMRITWSTVGRCISRARHFVEPDPSARLNGLVNIGIDETSYRKGHKYITVVVNHDTNNVVWVADGYGKNVLTTFFETLTAEQRASIQTVTADGAKWISECVKEYIPHAVRCIDAFHVVEWINEALSQVRIEAWREAYAIAKNYGPVRRGRPDLNDEEVRACLEAREKATAIKNSSYALWKNPENLTETQSAKLAMIESENPKLFRAYRLKEKLRQTLKIRDPVAAKEELDHWIKWAQRCRIPQFVELQRKIRRHYDHIMNTIRLGLSNARIEAMNNKIKLIIRKAYGFRNLDNMLDLILFICSDISLKLPGRA